MTETNTAGRDPKLIATFAKALWEVDHKKLEDLGLDKPIAKLGVDSVALMEVIGFLEEELELHFPEERLQQVQTLGDLADLVTALQAGK